MEMQKFMYSPLRSACRTLQSRQQMKRTFRHIPCADGIDKIKQHYCRYDNSAANNNLIMRQIHRQLV